MRYPRPMRTYIRSGLFCVVSAGTLLLSPLVQAQDAGEGGLLDGGGGSGGGNLSNCDPQTLLCSNAEMAQKLESKEELQIGIDTGWMPACPGDPTKHCSDEKIQIRAWIRFTPLDSGQPVFSIDMPGKYTKMDARWPDTDGITLSLAKGPTGTGSFKVAHGLTPSFAIYLDTPVFTGEISVDADSILPLLPGGQPFNYTAMNSTKFTPWGFETASMTVGGTDLKGSQLFAISFKDLGKIVNVNNMDEYIEGSFSFNAITKSTFTYQTNSVVVNCSEACSPIASQGSSTKMLGNFENAMDFLAHAKGTLRYSGELEFLPVINISSIAGFNISLSFPISVGLKVPYDSKGLPKDFPNATVHMPLPNIYMDTDDMKFSTDVDVGKQEQKTRLITNTGEMEAMITEVSSTSSAFKVSTTSTKLDADSGEFELPVIFKPPKPGKYSGTINIKTNDPDTPVWSFKVTGGKGEEIPPDQDAGVVTPGEDGGFEAGKPNPGAGFYNSSDGGCGCRTSPTPSGIAVTSLALLGLGLALLRRNRRI